LFQQRFPRVDGVRPEIDRVVGEESEKGIADAPIDTGARERPLRLNQ
jgi:hypothetical protein